MCSYYRYVVLMRSIQEVIARNIRVAAAEKDWSLAHVAELAEMSKQALSKRLQGETAMKLDDLARLARALDIPFSRLVAGVDEASEMEVCQS